MTIKTNHHWRDFVYRHDVPAAVLAVDFDYQGDDVTDGYFCYRGTWYHLDQFMRVKYPGPFGQTESVNGFTGHGYRELNVDENQAKTIRGLIRGEIDPERIEATADWIRQCYHRPPDDALIMHAIDATLETHGVEAIWPLEHDLEPIAVYCNAGDPYVATIMQCADGRGGWNAPYIGVWGDFVARRNCR